MSTAYKDWWVVVWLKGKDEIWEEISSEAEAHRYARSLGTRVVKVVQRRQWVSGGPS